MRWVMRWFAPKETMRRNDVAKRELAQADGRLAEARWASKQAMRRVRMLEARVELLRLGNGH